MLAMALVLIAIIGTINVVNYANMVGQADGILAILADNDGHFPETGPGSDPANAGGDSLVISDTNPSDPSTGDNVSSASPADTSGSGFGSNPAAQGEISDNTKTHRDPYFGSPELPYESRYFSVMIDGNGDVMNVDTVKIAAIDDNTAECYAGDVISSGSTKGFRDSYRYIVSTSSDSASTLVIFLDCSQRLSNCRSFLITSTLASLVGLATVLVLIILFSGRMIKPVLDGYEKQKRFITDAGHEIRTPITVISTDADVLEMENGQNEWVTDIKAQTTRLAELTNDLVFLSRMDEAQPKVQMIEFPFSDLVQETADGFKAAAKAQGKTFTTDIEPLITVNGDEKSLRQLVSILLDNALKYSPEGGSISLSLKKDGRSLKLVEENTASYDITKETVDNMFERFYRADSSHSTDNEKGGYGIGLSIAKAVVAAHKGKISASSKDSHTLTVTVTLPCSEMKYS